MEKLFCIGFSKTGTTSLENALKLLGYNVCKGHYNNNHTNYLVSLYLHKDFDELDKVIQYFDAFCDIPFGGTDFYLYLSQKYPNAKFINTTRDSEKWYTSLVTMLTEFDDNLETALDTFHKKTRYGASYYMKKEFGIEVLLGNKEKIIQHFQKHNKAVEDYFKNKPGLYLQIDVTQKDIWNQLSTFLGREVPNVEFPHANKAAVKKEVNVPVSKNVNSQISTLKSKIKNRMIKIIKKL